MFPLLPASVCIVYGAQGEGWKAVVGDLSCPPRMAGGLHWLANYVMLSRAEDISGLLLLRGTTREALEKGAPQYLIDEIDRLRNLEKKSTALLQQALKESKILPPELLTLFDHSAANSQANRHLQMMSASKPKAAHSYAQSDAGSDTNAKSRKLAHSENGE